MKENGKAICRTTCLYWSLDMAEVHQQQHAGLIALADRILRSVHDADYIQSGAFTRLRLTFARALIEHCADEGTMVRDAASRGLICPDLVTKFNRELVEWRASLAECNSAWPAVRVLSDPQGFYSCFSKIAGALRSYIDRENLEILSVIEQSAGRRRQISFKRAI